MDYRLHFLNARGQPDRRADFECSNDGDAFAKVAELTDGRAMELWEGTRLMRWFAPQQRAMTTPGMPKTADSLHLAEELEAEGSGPSFKPHRQVYLSMAAEFRNRAKLVENEGVG